MQSRAGNWMIIAGAVFAFLGLCVMAASFGEHEENNLLGVGASIFALGILGVSGGLFVNAQRLKAGPKSAAVSAETEQLRGGCERCRKENPVVNCKVHQLHLCGKCLAEHYDFRSCVYVPSTRRNLARVAKSMTAKAHG